MSLALMALVAATATRSDSAGSPRLPRVEASTTTTTAPNTGGGATGTTTTAPGLGSDTAPSDSLSLSKLGAVSPGAGTHSTTTTTAAVTAPPTTTTPTTQAPTGTSYPGYLQPPQDASTTYGFTGQGSTRISVTWSDATYLTLQVTCPGFDQSTGGSSAMALSIPDAQGACSATLSEPTTENDTLSYTLVIGPG